MRKVRALVAAAAVGSAACSVLLSYDDFDRAYGTDDGGPDGADAGPPPDAAGDAPLSPDGGQGGDATDAGACAPEPPCDADLGNDPANCGACGRKCLDTTPKCDKSMCGAELAFAWFGVSPTGVAVDDKYFYGIGKLSGALAPLEGGAARSSKTQGGSEVLAYYTQDPRRIVARGTDLYWTQAGAIAYAPNALTADGGANVAKLVVTGQVSPWNIAVDDTYVFWTNAPTGGDVWRATIASPSDAKPFTGQESAYGVALDGQYVYWTTSIQGGAVWRARRDGDGSDKVTVADGQSYPSDLFVDADGIYWTNGSASGSVMKLARGQTKPEVLASGRNVPARVVVRAPYAYWFEVGAGGKEDIMRVPLCGGAPLRLVAATDVSDLAVEDTRIYWATGAAISKVAR